MPGKQKKPRLSRREKIAKVVTLVETANVADNLADELNNLTLKDFDGIDLKVEFQTSKTLKQEDMDQIFDLLKTNMQDMYEKSDWGWDESKKRNELAHENAKYLIIKKDGKILAFTHFRFEVEVNVPVLYCYELQVAEEIQRKGFGTYLMNVLLLVAYKFKSVKAMLTIFTHNTAAHDFYVKSLGFRRDETCPYEEEGKCYIILSKCLDKALIDDIKRKMYAA